MSKKKYIIANWKNHPESWAEAEQILDFVGEHLNSADGPVKANLVLCPPLVFLEEVGKFLNTLNLGDALSIGAQDISIDDNTSLTGEVSGPILFRLGVRYVIVGHSERRWKLGESNAVVNKKLKAVLKNNMIPIVCLGERERDSGYKEFLRDQTGETLAGLSTDEVSRCLIAYEPVWAISTNPGAKPDTPESAISSIGIIKEILNTKYQIQDAVFLYGGSINSLNVEEFLRQEGLGGVLVGSASVNREEFVKILEKATFLGA